MILAVCLAVLLPPLLPGSLAPACRTYPEFEFPDGLVQRRIDGEIDNLIGPMKIVVTDHFLIVKMETSEKKPKYYIIPREQVVRAQGPNPIK